MGIVVIECPETGRTNFTGLRIDRSSFRRMPAFFDRTFCPICRVNHEWFAQDAWVSDFAKNRLADQRKLSQDRIAGT